MAPEALSMRGFLDLIQPWHLVVFAVVAFLFFGAIGLFGGSGHDSGHGGRR
jgi:hypothetical protein